jgi:hypothetical protein
MPNPRWHRFKNKRNCPVSSFQMNGYCLSLFSTCVSFLWTRLPSQTFQARKIALVRQKQLRGLTVIGSQTIQPKTVAPEILVPILQDQKIKFSSSALAFYR